MERRVDLNKLTRLVRRGREINPVLALACEGGTELAYASYFATGYKLRIRGKPFKGLHDERLIDEALEFAAEVAKKYEGARVIPAVMFDLEGFSNRDFARAKRVIAYAEARGIRIWINIPIIERWYVLHFKHFGMQRSKKNIETELKKVLQAQKLHQYKKPGDVSFYKMVNIRTETATINCASSHNRHLRNYSKHCMCNFVAFVTSFT